MDSETRGAIRAATQAARSLLEADFAEQLQGDYDVMPDGRVGAEPSPHLTGAQRALRARIVASIEHKRGQGMTPKDAVDDYLRDSAFTDMNRFVALKMLEARGLVRECISKGENSSGFTEFCGLAEGLKTADGAGYRLYIESIFDELSTEVKVLFDRRDPASALWPRRQAFQALLIVLNSPDLAGVWGEDETIGWVYQYFNGQEERRKMRDESQTPRNNRELAVRNQFFTPRYVVQFLADNTLGRIWYEMRGTKTVLADRCEYMVRKPGEEWQARTKQDPRDILALDPACGSGHFLLYLFDLFLAIYQEAYADPESPTSEVTGRTLAQDYPTLDALWKAVPGLILANNLHGVDIDPRCAQIAQLALWMRAQRAFVEHKVARTDREMIQRSNIVIAEPMPGEKDLLQEFLGKLTEKRLEDLIRRALRIPDNQTVRVTKAMADSLADLVNTVWDGMRLAGEMGTLLKIEHAIARAVEKGRADWGDHLPLFRVTNYDLGRRTSKVSPSAGAVQEDFWTKAESIVFQALSDYGAETVASGNARRRLFAEDATQGLSIIDILTKTYSVVLMNPPFGQATNFGYDYLRKHYEGSHSDIYASFVHRAVELAPTGIVGAITSRSFLLSPRLEPFRRDIFIPNAITLIDLGLGVMDDARVESAAYIISSNPGKLMNCADCRIGRNVDLRKFSPKNILGIISGVNRSSFKDLPQSKILYSLPSNISALLSDSIKLEPSYATAREGMKSFSNERFVRLFWEVDPNQLGRKRRWVWFAKGGAHNFYFAPPHLVLNWESEGHELQSVNIALNGSTAQVRQASSYWYLPGVTYSKRSAKGFSARTLPAGTIFSSNGPAVLPTASNISPALILGWLNSRPIRAFLHLQSNFGDYSTGAIKRLPWRPLAPAVEAELLDMTNKLLLKMKREHSQIETSPYFVGVASSSDNASEKNGPDLTDVMKCWDRAVADAYGIEDETWIDEIFNSEVEVDENLDGADDEVTVGLGPERHVEEIHNSAMKKLSWAVGTAFRRFTLKPNEKLGPSTEGPFSILPSICPATSSELPFALLVNDAGHKDDIISQMRRSIDSLSGSESEWDSLETKISGQEENSLRVWVAKNFFPVHLQNYSQSGRMAPIYWQLSTQSSGYSAWLYIHGFSKDTLYRLRNDYLVPKLANEERLLEAIKSETEASPTGNQRKALAAQEVFVHELRIFLDEVDRVAPLWNPKLDDGVIINFAPLWRLVPHQKWWQKELKITWDRLRKGEYDWSHLAMHLWPERVVPKCANDRSLAIAHGLEDVFWVEGTDGKWKARPTSRQPVDELVAERTSEAVKVALKGLLEAPDPTAVPKRGRKAARA